MPKSEKGEVPLSVSQPSCGLGRSPGRGPRPLHQLLIIGRASRAASEKAQTHPEEIPPGRRVSEDGLVCVQPRGLPEPSGRRLRILLLPIRRCQYQIWKKCYPFTTDPNFPKPQVRGETGQKPKLPRLFHTDRWAPASPLLEHTSPSASHSCPQELCWLLPARLYLHNRKHNVWSLPTAG